MVTPAELVRAATERGLDLIAVTDHDTVRSTREARERGEAVGLTVVEGEEVTTAWPAQTHILAWYLTKQVKSGMSLEDTVDAIHDQGGLVVVPHPFMPTYFGSIQPRMLQRLIEKHSLDGIEMMSTVPVGKRRRRLLAEFYEANKHRLGAAIGASDCHFGSHDLGRKLTRYEDDFRAAVAHRTTEPIDGTTAPIPAVLSARQQWRALVDLPIRRMRGMV